MVKDISLDDLHKVCDEDLAGAAYRRGRVAVARRRREVRDVAAPAISRISKAARRCRAVARLSYDYLVAACVNSFAADRLRQGCDCASDRQAYPITPTLTPIIRPRLRLPSSSRHLPYFGTVRGASLAYVASLYDERF